MIRKVIKPLNNAILVHSEHTKNPIVSKNTRISKKKMPERKLRLINFLF